MRVPAVYKSKRSRVQSLRAVLRLNPKRIQNDQRVIPAGNDASNASRMREIVQGLVWKSAMVKSLQYPPPMVHVLVD